MAELMLLIGIPASGKTTFAKEFEKRWGFVRLSSDDIREELHSDMQNQDNNEQVFAEMYKRAKIALNNGLNVVLDATNISAKRRIHLLKHEFNKFDVTKTAMVFLKPYSTCLFQNSVRERKVPESVIKRMYENLQIPTYEEGWDEIYVRTNGDSRLRSTLEQLKDSAESVILNPYSNYQDLMLMLADEAGEAFYNIYDLPHDNPHHAFSVSRHTYHVWQYLIDHPVVKDMDKRQKLEMLWTALFHDTGKYFTKSFIDREGNGTKYAHFYSHENVSAQYALYNLLYMGYDKFFALRVAKMCLWHMRLLNMDSDWGSKSAKKFRDFVGQETFNKLTIFREADKNAK